MDQADCVLFSPLQPHCLPDKILLAFHEACDQGDLEIARRLLDCCETATRNAAQSMQERRRAAVTLCAAHERLWLLRKRDESMRPCAVSDTKSH